MTNNKDHIPTIQSWIPRIILVALSIILLQGLTACQVFDLFSRDATTPEVIRNWLPSPSPTATSDLASLPSPTVEPTLTPTPAPTFTPTPSITPSPTAARINATNAPNLNPYLQYSVPFIQGEIQFATWSPGELFIMLSTTKGIHFLDPSSLDELTFFPGLSPLAESQSGIVITTSSESLGWIDLDTGQYHPLTIPGLDAGSESYPLALNPQGDTLVSVDPNRGDTLQFYDFPTLDFQGEHTITHPNGVRTINQILYSSQGEELYLEILRRDNRLCLVRFDPDQPDATIDLGVENGFRELTTNGTGEFIAYQSDTPTVRKTSNGSLWNTLSASFIGTLNNNQVEFTATAISFQDPTSLGVSYRSISRNPESIVIVRDINTGQTRQTYNRIPGRIISLDFTTDGSRFLVTTEEGFVRIYNQQGEQEVVSDRYDIKHSMDISPDGSLVAVPTHRGVELYQPDQDTVAQTFGDYPATDHLDAFFIDQETLAISVFPYVGDPYTEIWDITSGSLVRKHNLANCTFSANGDYLACSSNSVQVLDAKRGLLIGNFGQSNQVFHFRLSPYGKYLSLCSFDLSPDDQVISYQNVVWLLDIITGTRMRNLVKEGPACGKMAFTNSGQFLVSASGGIWSVPEGELESSFSGSPEMDIILHPNNNFFLVGQRLIAMPSGAELGQIDITDHPLSIRFTSDGTRLVILTENELSYWRVNP